MKIKQLKEEHRKELDRIRDSVPKEWFDKLMKKEKPAQVILDFYKKLLVDEEASDELKKKVQLVLDSEMLDKEEDVVDPVIEKQINDYIDSEIAKSVARGTLPKGKKFRNIKKKIKK